MIDFSDIDEIRRTVEYCNQLTRARAPPVRRRPGLHRLLRLPPGRHQEGLRRRWSGTPPPPGVGVDDLVWAVPYLPIDPRDVGRTYEAVIRVNSQSGKGGVAYLMKNEYHLDLPRRLQIEFSQVVQRHTDDAGGEVSPPELWEIFSDEYLPRPQSPWGRFRVKGIRQTSEDDGVDHLSIDLVDGGEEVTLDGRGNGPIAAFVDALCGPWRSTSGCWTTPSTR